jgi:hypothetical protein
VAIGSAGFSAGGTDGTSLAFSPAGEPYVAYADSAVSVKATVMKFDGANWVNVGTPGFSAGKPQYPSLAFSLAGNPYLAYSDVGNSNKATVMKYDAPAGISEPENVQLSVYPNPATDKITVEIQGTATGSRLAIISTDGREVLVQTITDRKTVINTGNLPGGVYFVRLTGDRTVMVEKIIRQ